MICNILTIKYLKMFNREISYDVDNRDLFPSGWFSSTNYKFKNQLLLESLEKKLTIIDTTLYQQSIEEINLNRLK